MLWMCVDQKKVERRTSGGMDRSSIAIMDRSRSRHDFTRSFSYIHDANTITIRTVAVSTGPIMHLATKFALAGAGFVALRWSWRMGRFIYVAFTFQVEVPTQ